MDVLEVNISTTGPTMPTVGSGSGYSMRLTPYSEVDPKEDRTLILNDEEAGQMYAYRYNDTHVVLGSRKGEIFGAAVGTGSISDGQYKCVANSQYAEAELSLRLNVSSKLV